MGPLRAAVAAVLLGVGVAACAGGLDDKAPTPVNFAAAIDRYLADHPERVCTVGFTLPYDTRPDNSEDPAFDAARRDELHWLDGLAEAGLLYKGRTTSYGTSASGPTPIDEYVLSDEGRHYIENEALSEAQLGGVARFCVAETKVGQIAGFAPPTVRDDGEHVTTVRYRPAIAREAPWATSRRARNAMPWLGGWARQQLAERSVTLHLTSDGWDVF